MYANGFYPIDARWYAFDSNGVMVEDKADISVGEKGDISIGDATD